MGTYLFNRPRFLALTMMVIVALGVFAFQTVGRQEDPTLTNLFATVTTPFPGADPARVEALVTEKVEAELREIPEIDTISSTSRTGISIIQIELSMFISDIKIEQVWSEIRDALAEAAKAFPAGAVEPIFNNDRTGAFTMIATFGAEDGREVYLPILGRLGEALQERLRQIPNTKRVELYGAPTEEIQVTINSDQLASLSLTPNAIAAAIQASDAKVSAGRMRGSDADYLIEIEGEIDSLSRIRNVPIATGLDGTITKVGDLAQVTRGYNQPLEAMALSAGKPVVMVAARVEDDKQVDVWSAWVRDEVGAFQANLADGVALDIIFDQSDYTTERLFGVAQNMAIGVALVVIVLFLTMGWRSALVVALMLPLTSLLSLVILQKLGVTIHQMSVTGLIVALGLLVDAAIVTTDEVKRRLTDGQSAIEAIRNAGRRLAMPLTASTLTTVLAFVPMAALPGPAGDFVGSIALSVIVMLISSLILALTLTPALAGMILRVGAGGAPNWWRDGMSGGPLGKLFSRSIDLALRWPKLAAPIAMLPAIVGFLAFPTLTAQFFPGVDRNQFHIQLEMPDGSSMASTRDAAMIANTRLEAEPEISQVQWVIGRSAPAFYYNILDNRDNDPGFAEALITTNSPSVNDDLIPRLQVILDQAVPQARILVRGLKQGPPVDAPLELRIVGPSLEVLRLLGNRALELVSEVPSVTHARTDLEGGAPKLVFKLDEDAVRLAGLDYSDVARQLESLSEGVVGGSLIEGPEELAVRVRLSDLDRRTPSQFADLTIVAGGLENRATDDFPGVPLHALGSFDIEASDSAISRRDGERVNTVQAFLQHGVLPDEALGQVQTLLERSPLDLPAGYRLEWGGESDARGETVNNLLSVVGLVVVGTIATIVITFNSWRLSAIAFVTAGLSAGLSLLALEIFNYPFGIQALIGVIGAIGVSINAAIIILTALQGDALASQGDIAAMRRVVITSSRHIVSTTITTFGGFLPLILDGGGFWPPFAMAIAGGVLLSTITSFYFVPPCFRLIYARRTIHIEKQVQALELPTEPARANIDQAALPSPA